MTDPALFGDDEPEDAWQHDDPLPILVDNLLQRLELLEHSGRRVAEIRADLLTVIEFRLARFRRLRDLLPERDQLRVDQLVEDLDDLKGR